MKPRCEGWLLIPAVNGEYQCRRGPHGDGTHMWWGGAARFVWGDDGAVTESRVRWVKAGETFGVRR